MVRATHVPRGRPHRWPPRLHSRRRAQRIRLSLEWARLFSLAAVALPTADLVDELARHKLAWSNNTSTLLAALATILLTGGLLFPNILAQLSAYLALILLDIFLVTVFIRIAF